MARNVASSTPAVSHNRKPLRANAEPASRYSRLELRPFRVDLGEDYLSSSFRSALGAHQKSPCGPNSESGRSGSISAAVCVTVSVSSAPQRKHRVAASSTSKEQAGQVAIAHHFTPVPDVQHEIEHRPSTARRRRRRLRPETFRKCYRTGRPLWRHVGGHLLEHTRRTACSAASLNWSQRWYRPSGNPLRCFILVPRYLHCLRTYSHLLSACLAATAFVRRR